MGPAPAAGRGSAAQVKGTRRAQSDQSSQLHTAQRDAVTLHPDHHGRAATRRYRSVPRPDARRVIEPGLPGAAPALPCSHPGRAPVGPSRGEDGRAGSVACKGLACGWMRMEPWMERDPPFPDTTSRTTTLAGGGPLPVRPSRKERGKRGVDEEERPTLIRRGTAAHRLPLCNAPWRISVTIRCRNGGRWSGSSAASQSLTTICAQGMKGHVACPSIAARHGPTEAESHPIPLPRRILP